MPKILVCQHVPFEILGTFDPLLKKHSFRIRYVNFGRHPNEKPKLEGYNGLILLGGPMSVYQTQEYPNLETELSLIQSAMDKDIPILGICLGAQLIARALGAKVYPNETPEIGWFDVEPTEQGISDPLIRELGPSQKIFQWHKDTFDLPKDAVHLAKTSTCFNQAFRYKSNVYGFQFHLEVDSHLIERWLTVPIHQPELESVKHYTTVDKIREENKLFLPKAMTLSNQVFSSFINLFGQSKQTHILKTR